MRGLAFRRHQKERMINKALRLLKSHWSFQDDSIEMLAIWSKFKGDNFSTCSCWQCGNPRKHLGEITIQERREFQDVRLA